MNIPNSLTIARIALAPVLAIAMLPELDEAFAAAVFAAGMATDFVDGHLARTRGQISRFGTLMDPIADKLFVGTALVSLAIVDNLAVWVVLVVFARELLVTALRFAARRQGVIIPANQLGKAKTIVQSLVVFVLIFAAPTAVPTLVLVYAMVAVTILSGAVYAIGYFRGRSAPRRRIAERDLRRGVVAPTQTAPSIRSNSSVITS